MPDPSDFAVIGAMEHLGGSFVQALGQLLRLADSDNTRRLKAAFPEYWEKYRALAARQPSRTEGTSHGHD